MFQMQLDCLWTSFVPKFWFRHSAGLCHLRATSRCRICPASLRLRTPWTPQRRSSFSDPRSTRSVDTDRGTVVPPPPANQSHWDMTKLLARALECGPKWRWFGWSLVAWPVVFPTIWQVDETIRPALSSTGRCRTCVLGLSQLGRWQASQVLDKALGGLRRCEARRFGIVFGRLFAAEYNNWLISSIDWCVTKGSISLFISLSEPILQFKISVHHNGLGLENRFTDRQVQCLHEASSFSLNQKNSRVLMS